jgi:hypothetical protein
MRLQIANVARSNLLGEGSTRAAGLAQCLDALGAHGLADVLLTDQHFDLLNVGVENATGVTLREAHVVARNHSLAAGIANCHEDILVRILVKCRGIVTQIGGLFKGRIGASYL